MIVITGAAGFIGSCMASKLNHENHHDLILVDDFSKESKKANWQDKQYIATTFSHGRTPMPNISPASSTSGPAPTPPRWTTRCSSG